MDNIKELVELLRRHGKSYMNLSGVRPMLEAADALEAQAAEIERLTRERDAAVEDMKNYIDRNIHGEVGVYACDLCKHGGRDSSHVCRKKCHDGVKDWEWRGPQKEE